MVVELLEKILGYSDVRLIVMGQGGCRKAPGPAAIRLGRRFGMTILVTMA
jgi:hypothetical protein